MKTLLLAFLPLIIFAQQNIVEPFLPDIFSKFPNVRDITISKDGNEMYFSAQSYVDEVSFIACVKK